MMKQLSPIFLAALSLALTACGSSTPQNRLSDNNQICIPQEYAIHFPSGSGPVTSGFDPEGGGYGTSIRLGGEEVARLISDYKTSVRLGDKVYQQSLYVMLVPAAEVRRTVPEPVLGQPLEDMPTLIRVDDSPLAWAVVEQLDGDHTYWGNCSNTFTQPESFECLRTLVIGDLGLTYTLARENLHLYSDIDELLQNKVNHWRCSAGGIPLEH